MLQVNLNCQLDMAHVKLMMLFMIMNYELTCLKD